MVIKPVKNGVIFLLVQFHLDGLQRFNVQYVVSIVEGRFFIIKGRKSNSLEMPSISLFSSHHDPHGAPLGLVYWLNNFGGLIDKGDSTCDMVQNFNGPFLLPGHWHIFKEFKKSVRDVF